MQFRGLYFFIMVVFLGCSPVNSQVLRDYDDLSIFFGDLQKSKSNVESLGILGDSTVVCVQNESSFARLFSKNKWKYSFDIIDGYTFPEMRNVKFYGQGKQTTLINYTLLGNHLLAISYRSSFGGQGPSLFYHLVDPSSYSKNNHGFPLSGFQTIHGKQDAQQLSFFSSFDSKYAALFHLMNSGEKNVKTLEYALFKDDFSTPAERRLTLEVPLRNPNIVHLFPVNKKNQVFIFKDRVELSHKRDATNKTTFYNPSMRYSKGIFILGVDKEGKVTEKRLLLKPNIYYTDVAAYRKKDTIYVVGIYSTLTKGEINGIMVAKFDLKGHFIQQDFAPFKNQFYRIYDRMMKFNSYKESHYDASHSAYDLIGFYKLPRGVVTVSEYSAIEYHYSTAGFYGGGNTVDSYFWSNNVIVSKINTSGEMVWTHIVPKVAASMNDNGYFLSTAIYKEGKNLHLFFNDNKRNYDEQRNYRPTEAFPDGASLTANNTITHVCLNLENGTVKRKNSIGKKEMGVVFVPRLALPLYQQNKLFIYARSGRKQRIGSFIFH